MKRSVFVGIFLARQLHALLAISLLLPLGMARSADDAAAEALPPNLGYSLRQLIAWHQGQPQVLSAFGRRARLAAQLPGHTRRWQTNANVDRSVVNVTLDGTVPVAEVRLNLQTLGLEILAMADAQPGGAVLSARLPLDVATRAASLPGVRSIALVHRPWKRIGKVTTNGVFALDATGLSPSTDGRGVTVGVISDSFDIATQTVEGKPLSIHAADDIASGDLPGPGNPKGHLTPVTVLAEGSPSDDETYYDEGRAMLQIIHDLAPGAALAFATAGETPEIMADHIRALRANADTPCDVIVDDITFPEEPMFFDGPAALAVYDVTHDTTLPGHKVLYYSAAGNEGDMGYVADFNPIAESLAIAGSAKGNLKFDQVPGQLALDGYHNFDTRLGKVTLAQQVTVSGEGAEVDLQWDSPPGNSGVGGSADYNLLVFDAGGNYLPDLSGKDRNTIMGNAMELIDLPAGDQGAKVVYQLAITCASHGLPSARHLRYVVNSNGTFTAKFTGHNAPTIFGHSAAVGADAVAAYDATYYSTAPERYTALGPVTILFDRDGKAQTSEVRQQPTLAAVDGVNTTFFGFNTDRDSYPNFYGTSAAAPHAAACAALLLQIAGGPGSLTNQQARALLQGTATAHSVDANLATRTASLPGATTSAVTLSEVRDDIDPTNKKKFFQLSFTGADTQSLRKIVITLNATAMTFDDSASGAPFAVGAVSGGLQKSDVSATLGSNATGANAEKFRNQLTVFFTPGVFKPGATVSFGLGINKLNDDLRGLDAIQWAMLGTQFSARLKGPGGNTKAASLSNDGGTLYGKDYSPMVGSGLIDIGKAAGLLVASGPPTTLDSQVALTPGNVLLTTNKGRLVETTPRGEIVQSFTVANAKASTVLANGKVAVLCKGASGPFLTLLDPRGGTPTTVNYPGWQQPADEYSPDQIASQGNFVFVIDAATPQASGKTASRILRYDSVQDTWQNFGAADVYTSLLGSVDGLVHATVGMDLLRPEPSEVYDPGSLQLLRTEVPLSTGLPPFGTGGVIHAAIDVDGNTCKFGLVFIGNSNYTTVLKSAPDGTVLATLDPQLLGYDVNSYSNLQVNADGKVFVTVPNGFLAISPAFDKVSKSLVSIGDYPTVALIGP